MSFNSLVSLAINRIGFLKPREKALLSEIVDTERVFRNLSLADVEQIIRRRLRTRFFEPSLLLRRADTDSAYFLKRNIQWVDFQDGEYPPLLREIYDPPFLMYYRGTLPPVNTPCLGVVGTRMPTGKAKKAAFELGVQAGSTGIPVISGLARGIDGVAHRGCVDEGGKTYAVLGSGIDTLYPREHKRLALSILENNGGIISEYPPGEPPAKYNFPARNRIISGLSRGVVIVECPKRSGALITADYALEQGRDLFVHIDGLYGKAGEGTAELAEEGATTIDGFESILHEWSINTYRENEYKQSEERIHPTGTMMGKLLEKELLNTVTHYGGEYYRSI
jgi:DNA processing protein